MTLLELNSFIENKCSEVFWYEDCELILFVEFCDLAEFTNMVGYNYLSEGGVPVSLKSDCIVIDLLSLCEWFYINPLEVQV
ncbi:MAG: hypothetical protein WCO84_01280 [bacterium]